MTAHRVFFISATILFFLGALWAKLGHPQATDLFVMLFGGLGVLTMAHWVDQK